MCLSLLADGTAMLGLVAVVTFAVAALITFTYIGGFQTFTGGHL